MKGYRRKKRNYSLLLELLVFAIQVGLFTVLFLAGFYLTVKAIEIVMSPVLEVLYVIFRIR